MWGVKDFKSNRAATYTSSELMANIMRDWSGCGGSKFPKQTELPHTLLASSWSTLCVIGPNVGGQKNPNPTELPHTLLANS